MTYVSWSESLILEWLSIPEMAVDVWVKNNRAVLVRNPPGQEGWFLAFEDDRDAIIFKLTYNI